MADTAEITGDIVSPAGEAEDWEADSNERLHAALANLDERSRDILQQRWLSEDKAILQETPSLQSMLTLIKMIATIAPLGGLLGTVTGMITVFQQITVYGAGDPAIMAGGSSSALILLTSNNPNKPSSLTKPFT